MLAPSSDAKSNRELQLILMKLIWWRIMKDSLFTNDQKITVTQVSQDILTVNTWDCFVWHTSTEQEFLALLLNTKSGLLLYDQALGTIESKS